MLSAAAPAPPRGTSTRVGAYEILGSLGAGGMGEVYRARDTRLGRDVALKVLPDTFAADPDRLARFAREAQLLASVNHPHTAANRLSCGLASAIAQIGAVAFFWTVERQTARRISRS